MDIELRFSSSHVVYRVALDIELHLLPRRGTGIVATGKAMRSIAPPVEESPALLSVPQRGTGMRASSGDCANPSLRELKAPSAPLGQIACGATFFHGFRSARLTRTALHPWPRSRAPLGRPERDRAICRLFMHAVARSQEEDVSQRSLTTQCVRRECRAKSRGL